MSNYIGNTPDNFYNGISKKYFYGLRRTDDGELFLAKADQTQKGETIEINKIGDPVNNFPNFEEGQDFYEGRNVNHEIVYENLNYEQFRWDDRHLFYYVNDEGELIVKINETHNYDNTTSSDGL